MANSIKRIKKIAVVLFIISGVCYGLVNYTINNLGVNFAKKHHAYKYEKGRFQEIYRDPLLSSNDIIPYPSFFKYYNENDEDLILKNSLFKEYNKMNMKTYNLDQTFKLFLTLLILFNVFGIIFFKFKRIQCSGFYLSSLVSLFIFFDIGMLSLYSIIFVLGFFLSAYLMKNAKFIDYDQPKFSLFKK